MVLALAQGLPRPANLRRRSPGFWDLPQRCARQVLCTLVLACVAMGSGSPSAIALAQASGLPAERVLSGHTGEVSAVTFSPDGKLLGSGGSDRTIRVWHADTGRLSQILSGHTGPVRALAFSTAGRHVASASADGTTRIWDIQSGKEVRAFSSQFGTVRSLAFSPDGKLLVGGGDAGALRIWDWETAQQVKAMKSGFGVVFSVAFSPDGRIIATGSADGRVHLWDQASGNRSGALAGHTGAVYAVAFSPDGVLIASGSADRTVRLWEVATGRPRGMFVGHTDEVLSLAFAPESRRVVSASADGTIRIWDCATGEEERALTVHHGPVIAVAMSPDGKYIASGGRDHTVRIQPSGSAPAAAGQAVDAKRPDDDVGPAPFPPPLAQVDLTIHPLEVRAGDQVNLLLTVKNTGKGPLYRFQGRTKSDDTLLNGHVFYFGKINAASSAKATVTIQIPRTQPSSELPVEIQFQEHNGFVPTPLRGVVVLKGAARPRFAYNFQIIDDGTGHSVGNGDGRVQKGEAVDLLLTLRNIGKAPAPDTWVEITNSPGQNLEIRPGMIRFGMVKPDETKQARVSFTVWPDFPVTQLTLKLFIQEKTQHVFLNEHLQLALDTQQPAQIVATNKIVKVTAESATILSGAGPETSVLASVGKNQSLAVTGELGDWYRVQISETELGWITKAQALAVMTLDRGQMPIPRIHGLETAKASQLIALTEQLQRAHSARGQIEQALRERERETSQLRAKLDELSASQDEKVSKAHKQLERERTEHAQMEQLLRQREEEMRHLQAKLEELSVTQTAQLSTAQEQLERERLQRAEAEQALRQHQEELQRLRSQLDRYTDFTGGAAIKKAPPAIALGSPADAQRVTVNRVRVIGAAASERGISRIEIRVNNELLARRQHRGVTVTPGEGPSQSTLEFSEWIQLREGANEVSVIAFDEDQLAATKTVMVTRISDRGTIWAVVIGISQYKSVHALRYADKDAVAFSEYLHSQVGVSKDNITLLTNNDATLFTLKRTLGTDLRRRAGPKDTVIVFYAGHGAPEPDSSSPDGDGLEKYLVPYDAEPGDLYATALPMREIETIFERLNSERVIFIMDSCYSGAAGGRTFSPISRRATVSDAFLTRLSKGKGRVVLTASRGSEISEERDEMGHGVFTYYLLKGLQGQADMDADRLITVDEVYAYVSQHVPAATGQNQHPVKKGEMEGQLILGQVR